MDYNQIIKKELNKYKNDPKKEDVLNELMDILTELNSSDLNEIKSIINEMIQVYSFQKKTIYKPKTLILSTIGAVILLGIILYTVPWLYFDDRSAELVTNGFTFEEGYYTKNNNQTIEVTEDIASVNQQFNDLIGQEVQVDFSYYVLLSGSEKGNYVECGVSSTYNGVELNSTDSSDFLNSIDELYHQPMILTYNIFNYDEVARNLNGACSSIIWQSNQDSLVVPDNLK